jgi:rRNA maturation protein Nop10
MKQALPVHQETQKTPLISFMTVGLQNLLRLQALEFDEVSGQNSRRQATELRSQIPTYILDRYDRLRAREKKAIAVVLNSTCTACHMRQPIGKIAALMRGEEIQVCDSCGRYLLLSAPAVESGEEAQAPAARPTARKAAGARLLR